MKLRTKVLLAIIMTWGLMLAVTYLGARQILVRSYIELENQQAISSVTRAKKAIDQLWSGLNSIVTNWSVWNDAYQFALDKNQAFITSNLSVPIFLTSNLDIILIYNVSGDLVYGYGLNPERTQQAPISTELLDRFKPGEMYRKIIADPKVNSDYTGLLSEKRGIIYFAAHSIITSEGKGPPHGTMIMAKYIDAQEIARLKETTKIDLMIYPLDAAQKDSLLNEKYLSLSNSQGPLIERDSNSLAIYTLLRDINDRPIGLLQIQTERGIYSFGIRTIYYFNLIFALAGILLTLLLYYLLNIFVIKRLLQMNEKIINITETKNFSPTVREEGADEITSLEKETNKFLSIIHDYNEQKEDLSIKIRDEFDQVINYSSKLKESEKFLTSVINSMLSMLIMTDKHIKITTLNQLAEKEVDLTVMDAKGKSLFDVFPYLEPYKTKFFEAFNHQRIYKIDKILYAKKNVTRFFNVTLYPLIDDEEKFLVVRIDDVTEQISFEERLIQNDKMAYIGILTAGVAHEINNPVNFLSASVRPLKDNLSRLIELLKMYTSIKSENDFKEKMTSIEEAKEVMNLDYTLKETTELINGIKDGADRTAAIVSNLRTYFRSDENAMQYADLHEGLDSTLSLLNHKYKNRITIIREYNDIPKVACFRGKINQVFANILSNAIDSIPTSGEIRIKTQSPDNKHVIISIKDTGTGIKEENLSKIFDPFFSTKEAGQEGTGFGLSISASIVHEHHGTIDVKSKIGEGTEFIITLLVDPQSEESNELG